MSSPFPFPLCVPRLSSPLCVHPFPCLVLSSPRVCGGCHAPTLCPAVLLPLQSSLSVSLFHHHHPSSPLVCVKRVCVGKGEEDEHTCVIQKACGKKRCKKEKQKTTCGVNTLSPTLVPTMPTHPSLHSSHHKSCFPLAVPSLFLCSSFLAFRQEANGLCDVKQAHKSGTPFLVPTLFLQPTLSSCQFTSLLSLWCCDECACPNPCNQ